MEVMAKLFGNFTKVKLMRLFLFNQDNAYTLNDVIEKVRSGRREVKKELSELLKIGMVKKRSIIREINKNKSKKKSKKQKKVAVKRVYDTGYTIDHNFKYLDPLRNLLIIVSMYADEALVRKFASVAKLRLFIASGIFIQEWNTRIDLLIVGDNLNISKLETVIENIEAEVGKEIAYSAFETSDFEYRYGIHDKLIRDIFDFPHTVLLDRLGVDEK